MIVHVISTKAKLAKASDAKLQGPYFSCKGQAASQPPNDWEFTSEPL